MAHEHSLSIGYVALVDSAALIVAREGGFFAEQGLQVDLQREPSWASLRDHLLFGDLVAAHALAPLPLAATLGIASPRIPVITALTLSLNGNAITVSTALHQRLTEVGLTGGDQPLLAATALHRVIQACPATKLCFAVVSPVSNHHYQLRHWLQAAGIDPATQVQISVVPPRYMVEALRAGEIDGYCVGEPWGTLAAVEGVGMPIVSSYALWNNMMEKVLAVREDWALAQPGVHQALIRAVLAAGHWLDDPLHRLEAAPWVAAAIDVPTEVVALTLTGSVPGLPQQEDFHVFTRYSANFPWHSHAHWLVRQMQAAGQWPEGADAATLIPQVYRSAEYRQAAHALQIPVPKEDFVAWGGEAQPWLLADDQGGTIRMGASRIFDGSSVLP
ncbi:ABC transporter substrate-binding protein [Acidithiobacillus sp. MC6.1]|nr:ABC transporter substrate-binding protein [Acidithiobacillus sp. MC6.1]